MFHIKGKPRTFLDKVALVADAQAACLGHELGPWERLDRYEALSLCVRCGFFAVADTTPGSDSIAVIYGTATEVACDAERTTPTWATARQENLSAAKYKVAAFLFLVAGVVAVAVDWADNISDLV